MSKALATKNVAAVLLSLGIVLALSFAFVTPAKAQTTSSVSSLQAQVQALLAQISALQGTGSTATASTGACFTFTQNEQMGSTGGQVMWIQEFLNGHGFQVAASGAGSPGNETSYFGPATKRAVIAFQNAYASTILTPEGLTSGTGNWFAGTRAEANAICAGQSTGTGTTGTGTGTVTTGTGITISAASQPANSLAPMNATRVPFTTFTLTNNSGAAVTINGITVQRTGLANDNAFAGVILVDSNGLQYGNAQTFNSNHQATIGGTFTLQAGQSMTYTVDGNMELSPGHSDAGQVASISVVGINTSVPVSGTLPITGAQQTINESLTIGTATVGTSGYDPNGSRNEAIGTTGVTFSGLRITANNEDQKLYSITWNQTGSAGSTDLSNLATIVNGTSYPVTVDASGKYFTSTFPGGILISKGNSVDAYIKGDITGSNASSRTVEFDIYRASDIYLVGQTYGYGITPTNSSVSNNYTVGNNTTSGFDENTNPFYYGSTVTVTGGTLSTVSTASTVAPGNIGVNVTGQTLGGFTTNFTGEPVTVQSVEVHVATSTGALGLTNVTLVDQNGDVVAGPDDETYVSNGLGYILFNSSITFPVGTMTYTIKGTVESGSTNGSTFTLSTNPKSDWSGAVGQTSGATLSLTNTTITMSTMTVQPGALTISAASSPAASTITSNQSNFAVANIVLDASQSGEDVRLNSLPIVISATSTYGATEFQSNLTNCQLYNGSTVLNSQSIGSSQWAVKTGGLTHTGGELSATGIEANFVFDNSLTIPKGTSLTLTLECNVGGSITAGDQFSVGVDTLFQPTVTGAISGNSISSGNGLTINTGTSGTMTLGSATLSETTPTQTYSQVAGGTSGVQVGSFTLQPTTGTVTLQNISLKLNGSYASSSDLQSGTVTIWNGSTQVGSVNFSGITQNASGFYISPTTTVSVSLPQNQITTLTLKANISPIGAGQSGMSGHEILIGLNDAHGVSGNTSVDSGPGTMPTKGSGVAMFQSFPVVAQVTPSSTSFNSGNLVEFSVTASSNGPLGIGRFVFDVASTTGVTVANPELFYGTSASSPNTGILNGTANATSCVLGAPSVCTTQLGTPLEIPAGTTWYFLLKAQSVTNSTGATSPQITTTLLGDGEDIAPTTTAATTTFNFVWSPNSTTTATASSNDFTNGYGVNGLSSFGFSQTNQ